MKIRSLDIENILYDPNQTNQEYITIKSIQSKINELIDKVNANSNLLQFIDNLEGLEKDRRKSEELEIKGCPFCGEIPLLK